LNGLKLEKVITFRRDSPGIDVAMTLTNEGEQTMTPGAWVQNRFYAGGSHGTHRDRVGGGTPPIRTDRGWLTLYHGSDKAMGEAGAGTYSAGALLLKLDSPATVTARTPDPFFVPEHDFERVGFVNNVVFPTGVIERGDTVEVYYGAADTHVAVTAYARDDLMALLEPVGSGRYTAAVAGDPAVSDG